MPYNCEECNELGARLNSIIGIRLCEKCVNSDKYKLICKSDAIKKYKLSKTDFDNNNFEEMYCKNPHYRSGPVMTLYYENEIINFFINKYNNLIRNTLLIDNPHNNIENTIAKVKNYYDDIKNNNKDKKINKILKKYDYEIDNLPNKIFDKVIIAKSSAEVERILISWDKEQKLYDVLKSSDIEEYITIPLCQNYITNNIDTTIYKNVFDIRDKIKHMLYNKEQVKQAIIDHKLPKKKYLDIYNNYICEGDKDIIELVNLIKDKEYRFQTLTKLLNAKELTLRSDSVLCSKYLNGSDEKTVEEVVQIMDEMNWFFQNTNYSINMRLYDENRRNNRRHNYYRNYDSDDEEYRQQEKEEYLKNKSDYVKKQSIKEWIIHGKNSKTFPPISLNDFINQIEKKLENNYNL